jgi:hypothetical protein
MGLVSKWLPLAIETRLAKGANMPYPTPEPIGNTLSIDGKAHYPQSVKDNIDKWIEQISKRLSGLQQNRKESEIPPEYRTAPTTKARLVKCWGGDMTVTKLRNMIKNGHVRCVEHSRQTYTFDKRNFPDYVSMALEE